MAALYIFKIILSVYIANHHVSAQSVKPLILNGDTVKIEDYPFYAGLNNCGAVILSNVWVLTAAHCIDSVDLRQRNYVWVGGETIANSIPVPYNYIHKHQGYSGREGPLINDIALIKLSNPLRFSKKIQPIKLPNGLIPNSYTTFVGTGDDETGYPSKTLKKVDLIKLSVSECIKLTPPQYHDYMQRNLKTLQTTNICTKREGNRPSICRGDSGGPLVSGNTVVGIASYMDRNECKNSRLAIFVNVFSYVPWIKTVTGL